MKVEEFVPPPPPVSVGGGNESVISLSSLKDLDNTEIPKRVRKRQNKSDKNTIALDI